VRAAIDNNMIYVMRAARWMAYIGSNMLGDR
jgi:hypothetical protein